jgi:oligopeptide transport system substrate-binding protein
MYEKGEIDWLGEPIARISYDAIPSLKAKGFLNWTEGAATQWLFINTKKFPYTNVNIRKALAYAIDRTRIMHDIMHLDHPSPPLGLIPKILKKERWHPWFRDNDKLRAQDYFARGLKELGLTLEQFPIITLSYIHSSSYAKIIQAIQQMWIETLGVSVKSESSDSPIFIHKLYNQDYEIARNGWVLQYNDPSNLLDIFKFKNMQPNFTGWENLDYIKETDAAYSCKEEEKWEHLEAAEKIFFEEMPSIPILDASVAYLQKPYVKEVRINHLFQIDFRDAYIED